MLVLTLLDKSVRQALNHLGWLFSSPWPVNMLPARKKKQYLYSKACLVSSLQGAAAILALPWEHSPKLPMREAATAFPLRACFNLPSSIILVSWCYENASYPQSICVWTNFSSAFSVFQTAMNLSTSCLEAISVQQVLGLCFSDLVDIQCFPWVIGICSWALARVGSSKRNEGRLCH